MAQFKRGDMFTCFDEVDYFVVTTNAVIKNNGTLVMGAGIAKTVRDRWPGVDLAIGKAIQAHPHPWFYGFLKGQKLCAFQVKQAFNDKADMALVEESTKQLKADAEANSDKLYALNFPAIGNGGLPYKQVMSVIQTLPDNVTVWAF